MNCNICPRKCGADRSKGVGICGVGEALKVARAGIHLWEEPPISGTKGSGTVFFSGCNLKCVYCQNYEISHNAYGKEITDERLAGVSPHAPKLTMTYQGLRYAHRGAAMVLTEKWLENLAASRNGQAEE